MRTLCSAIALCTSLTLAAGPALAYQTPRPLPKLSIKRSGKDKTSLKITVTVPPLAFSDLPRRPLTYTAEQFTISARARSPYVVEGNILGTGLALDLDGDGKAKSRVIVRCDAKSGAAVVSKGKRSAQLRPVGYPTMRYRRGNKPTIVRLSPRGAQALLYRRCNTKTGRTMIGLNKPSKLLALQRVVGPVVQVIVFQPIKRAKQQVKTLFARFQGNFGGSVRVHKAKVYEPLFGKRPGWTAARMAMIPLPRKGKLKPIEMLLKHADPKAPVLVFAAINWAPSIDVRLRGAPVIKRLK
jgi:hypothetical protein